LLLACCYVFRGETVLHLAAICWHCRLSRLLRVWSVFLSKQSRCHGTKLLLQARASIPCSECCVLPREEIYTTCLGLCRESTTVLSRNISRNQSLPNKIDSFCEQGRNSLVSEPQVRLTGRLGIFLISAEGSFIKAALLVH
jgi:hypothetical protein